MVKCLKLKIKYADMAELADALASGANGRKFVQVQVLLSAPNSRNPNLVPISVWGSDFYCSHIFSSLCYHY